MMNNKEDLTDATMQALQGKLKDISIIESDAKRRLRKFVEDYAIGKSYIEIFKIIMDIILPILDDTEIMKILNNLQQNPALNERRLV